MNHKPYLKLNKFNKVPTDANEVAFKKHTNFFVYLLKRKTKNYYNNLDINVINI